MGDKKLSLPKKCEICGEDSFVTKHRIRPGRKKGRYVPWNTIVLDAHCHSLAELGILSPRLLLEIVYDRINRSFKYDKTKEERAKELLQQRVRDKVILLLQKNDMPIPPELL